MRTASTSQYSRVIARMIAPIPSSGPVKTRPRNRAKAPSAASGGAHDGPGMWTPGGGTGSTLALPRRAFGARQILQNRATITIIDSAKISTGSIATTEPQSGMTNLLASSRMPFQMSSNMRRGSVVRGAGDQHVGHDADGDAEQDQHRHARHVGMEIRIGLDEPVDDADHREEQPDGDRVPGVAK